MQIFFLQDHVLGVLEGRRRRKRNFTILFIATTTKTGS
jgi:hypothetical protein